MSAVAAPSHPSRFAVQRFLRCANCLTEAPEGAYRYGCCRLHGRHQEHRYCPACRGSIDWYGYTEVAR